MVCVDTLRLDMFNDEVMPNMTSLLENATHYTNTRAAGPWTIPSMAAAFTGKFPSYTKTLNISDNLPEEEITIPEVFKMAGWKTIGISENMLVSESRGFHQGFDDFFAEPDKRANVLVDHAIEKLQTPPDGKFFLYLHFMDPHAPFAPPKNYLEKFKRGEGRFETKFNLAYKLLSKELEVTDGEAEQIRGLYMGECAHVDAELARLIQFLIDNQLWDDTAFVFFADHGEELNEHGWWTHGHAVYDEVLKVPLIFNFPESKGEKIDELISLRGLGSILFKRLGINPPPAFNYDGTVFFEGVKTIEDHKGIVTPDNWKLFVRMESLEVELYNLNKDPLEKNNLYEKNRDRADEILKQIADIASAAPPYEGKNALTEQQIEELKSLGYLGS